MSANVDEPMQAGSWHPELPMAQPHIHLDEEKQEVTNRTKKMNRIDGKYTGVVGTGSFGDSDTDSSISVGKQMEMEAGNAIKYRTCSWPKVSVFQLRKTTCIQLIVLP